MLINGKRALAYVQKVAWVKPIEGADNIELIGVLGWTCVAKKGEFKEGDLCVYFEIDSKLPEASWSEFMAAKKYKVKTMKLGKFKVVSQGLALPGSAFGWNTLQSAANKEIFYFQTPEGGKAVNDDVTELLGVTYSVDEDNKRKANSVDKYKIMAQRRPNIFKKPWARWMMKREWGRKIMFVFFGKKKDKKNGWPQEVAKTDEERVQNMPYILENKEPWIATEKIDGSSTTFFMRKGKRNKHEFYVCSRNVVQDTPDRECYYDSNIYWEMEKKYNIKEVLTKMLEAHPNVDWITLQGETYGQSVQKRTYGLNGRDFMAFNLIFSTCGRVNPVVMTKELSAYGVPCVPIVDEEFILPDTVEELLTIATDKSKIDGGMREGLVFRSKDGARSFKAVSNEFLLKYHS